MKDQLIFDTTDAGTITDTDSVGAYVRAGKGGALVTYHGDIQANSTVDTFVPGDVSAGSDEITLTSHGFNSGDKVQFATDDTLPDPLVAATDYWVIYVDANTIKVASSQNNAELGIAINLIDGGVGNHTITAQPYDIRALDVHVVNSVSVSAVDLDIRDLTQADEITVFQGTDPWVIGDGGGSITVDAVDLDIRDLDAAQDSIQSWTHDGAGTAITSTVNGADTGLDVNIINAADIEVAINSEYAEDSAHVSGDVGSFALAVRNDAGTPLAADGDYIPFMVNADGNLYVKAPDSDALLTTIDADTSSIATDASTIAGAVHLEDVAHVSGDSGIAVWAVRNDAGTPLAADGDYIPFMMDADGSLFVNVTNNVSVSDAALANTAIANATNTLGVANTAEDVVASPLANRKYLWIYNNDNKKIYIGATGVSAATGFPLSPGSYVEMRAGAAVDIEWVSDLAGHDIRTLELS